MTSNNSKWRRFGLVIAFLVVAGTAAVASYSHIVEVALYGHQTRLVAHLLPLSIDGMLLIASIAMADDKAHDRHPRGWARVGFWGGAAVSTVANIAANVIAWGADPVGIFIAAIAPIVLLVSIEVVSRPGRPKAAAEMTEPVTDDFVADDAVVPVSPAMPPAEVDETGKREPYGPRNGERYSPRQDRRIRRGK